MCMGPLNLTAKAPKSWITGLPCCIESYDFVMNLKHRSWNLAKMSWRKSMSIIIEVTFSNILLETIILGVMLYFEIRYMIPLPAISIKC